VETVVVSPVFWFPLNRWIRGRDRADVSPVERQGDLTVYHPRFLGLPRLGRALDGICYALGILPLLRRLRRTFPFDLIDAHFAFADGFAAALLGRLLGVPTVITLRGTHDLRQMGAALRRPQVAWALRSATRLVAVSESLRESAAALGVDPKRVRVIPNGVDAERFRPGDRSAARARLGLPSESTILLSVGGFIEGKGHHRVVELLPALAARRPDLLYVAIGGAEPRDSYLQVLRAQVRRLGLEDRVRLAGARPHDEIPLWMAAADLFCLATRSEGWCNAIMEALACGRPVVSTRVGGNPELVGHGREGYLVPFWDGPAFAEAILTALETAWDREAIAARARAHSWERTAERVLEEFRACVGEAGTPAVELAP
jgi:glycosyltransferase involved in cell wall biosynthesis